MNIPFLSFDYTNSLIRDDIYISFQEFFDSKWYVSGKRVENFEKEYAAYNQTEYCVGLSNGLDALRVCLLSLNIGRGDEIIIPSNTYIATVIAVSQCGARPVFVEPDSKTYNIDPAGIEEKITNFTKAIIPVHLYGQSCEMDKIMDTARRKNLFVIEDNAQAQGAKYKGKYTGTFGDINATSFYPGKNLGALGEAGAVTTNNSSFAAYAAMIRNYGSTEKYYNEAIGFNMRMDECQGAFLSVKLRYLSEWNRQRQQIANTYTSLLSELDEIITPSFKEAEQHIFHVYMIRSERRDDLQKYLREKEIGTMIHYPVPPHLQKAYRHLNYKNGDFPIAEKLAETCLSLPIWPGMSENEISFVCKNIKDFYRR